MSAKNNLLALIIVLYITSLTNAQTRKPILRINTSMHTGRITGISTDAQGKYILTSSDDKTAKLWDATSGELIRTFRPFISEGHVGMLFACALSPDGRVAAMSGFTNKDTINNNIYLFNTNTGELMQRITGLENIVRDLEFSKDGKYLATAVNNGIRIYLVSKTISNYVFFLKSEGYEALCSDLSFDKSGRLATACFDGYLRLYDTNFNLINSIHASVGKFPGAITFSPDGSKIALCYLDNPIIDVFDGATLELLYKPKIPDAKNANGRFYSLSFSTDSKYLFGGGYFCHFKLRNLFQKYPICWQQIRRWNNAGKGSYKDFTASKNGILDIKPMPDNSIIFCGGQPDFGRMNANGNLLFYKDSEINDYRFVGKTPLIVSNEGNEIGFQRVGGAALFFSLKNEQLTEKPSGFNKLMRSENERGNITFTNGNDFLSGENLIAPKLNGKSLNFLDKFETLYNADISSDTTLIVAGTSSGVYCLTSKGDLKWKTPTEAEARSVNISGDGRTVIATIANGSISWFRMSDGALLLTLFAHPDNKRWILYTANGYYTCSKGGDELIGWHINNSLDKAANFYPAKNYADRFFRPDIISEAIPNCETDLEILKRKGEQISDNSQLPPKVKITSPAGDTIINNSQLTILVEVTDQGGGIDEVLLYQNGKLIESVQRGVTMGGQINSRHTKMFNITLTGGENRIKATAFNNSRTEAIADEIRVTYLGAKTTANLFLFLIGINEYKNPNYKLNYAVADALSIKTEIAKGTRDIFSEEETIFIQDTC